mgnify:FL=1
MIIIIIFEEIYLLYYNGHDNINIRIFQEIKIRRDKIPIIEEIFIMLEHNKCGNIT